MKTPNFRIICLFTPNYNHIGKYGVNSLYAYCKKHGYKFSLYDKNLMIIYILILPKII